MSDYQIDAVCTECGQTWSFDELLALPNEPPKDEDKLFITGLDMNRARCWCGSYQFYLSLKLS